MTKGSVVVRRDGPRFEADPTRVMAKLFVPGQEGFDHEDSRATAVVRRVLALSEDDVEHAFGDVVARFADRHRGLLDLFRRHAHVVSDRLDPAVEISDHRLLLIGATLTSEYSVEGAAVCNPSMVRHPDQSGVSDGDVRFLMSVRNIGEGHRSSIGFRTGMVDGHGTVSMDPRPEYVTTGRRGHTSMTSCVFEVELSRMGELSENAEYVLAPLGARFSKPELDARLDELVAHRKTRAGAERTVEIINSIAHRFYSSTFEPGSTLGERVLWPATSTESHGMEDARFLGFRHDDGRTTYYATYTAYDGSHIGQQLLETDDFVTFSSSPIVGPAAANKGLALFPRRVGGRYAALSRCDRETNSVTFSDDLLHWPASTPFQTPERWWEALQLGNCGPPIETTEGWLVLTHGVGPMRTYSIAAVLLDLDDPSVVLGSLHDPLLTASANEREGYVPNVVYSCGALLHGDHLVIPYGVSDGAIAITTVSLTEVLGALVSPGGG